MSEIAQRLEELGITLPPAAEPAGQYVPYVLSGNLLFVSGQVPVDETGTLVEGVVGDDLDVDRANALAREIAITMLAVVQSALGSLDRVARVVKLNGYVNAVPGFKQQPAVINGSSDLMIDVFGERGLHARAALGAGTLPGNVPVELEGVFEVK